MNESRRDDVVRPLSVCLCSKVLGQIQAPDDRPDTSYADTVSHQGHFPLLFTCLWVCLDCKGSGQLQFS